ncbi:MAG: FtsX-like permease family protein [Chitinivibrionales bacterium]|nr:FtsX-like permease family protein [Chitinivibrionales bacterium]
MNPGRIKEVIAVNTRLCIVEILSNKTRTFITSLGIFLGVGALLTNLSFIRGMDNDLKHNMEIIGGINIVKIRAVRPESAEERMKFQQSGGLTVEEVRELAQQFPYIQSVLPHIDMRWRPTYAKGNREWGPVHAVSLDYADTYNYTVSSGRWFSSEDVLQKRLVCVVGNEYAGRMFGEGVDPVGETVRLEKLPFEIIGMFTTKGPFDRRGREILIPYAVYTHRFAGHRRTREEVGIRLAGSDYVDRAERDLRRGLLALHRGVEDFEIEINRDKMKEMETARMGISILLWSIAGITLLVGGISIMNIMFATIGDRIREIGIRKALGAHRFDIFTQFIIEAVFGCVVGGVPGMMAGTLTTLAPEGVFPYIPMLSAGDYVLAFGFTVMVGFFSGLFPALKAAGMQPVEALRY